MIGTEPHLFIYYCPQLLSGYHGGVELLRQMLGGQQKLKYLLSFSLGKFVDPLSKQPKKVQYAIICFYRCGDRSSESLSKMVKVKQANKEPGKNLKPVYVTPGPRAVHSILWDTLGDS